MAPFGQVSRRFVGSYCGRCCGGPIASMPLSPSTMTSRASAAVGVRREGGAFQWVQGPPGDSLLPEAIGAVMEVTKWLKPSNSGHDLVTAQVCRPQRE